SRVLFLHETHSVTGRHEDDFEEAYRGPGGYIDRLAKDGDARLLWYLDHVHGSGPAYTVVTVTGIRDAGAWARIADRIHDGDLKEWVAGVDRLRHDSISKILRPLPWSGLQEIDLASVPVEPVDHELVLYMEDTAHPHEGMVHDYIAKAGGQYAPSLQRPNPLLQMVGAFQPAHGTGRRREIVLWQRVADHQALLRLFTTAVPPQFKAPGTWMHDALEVRDQWTSRLLRTSSWSPMT
ncbi:MAG TPA: hypothetical protein VKI19_05930, partial [Acidimicrobiales bacterium]|nr:hypothetical protein [Acidimicrobiales bacterium]